MRRASNAPAVIFSASQVHSEIDQIRGISLQVKQYWDRDRAPLAGRRCDQALAAPVLDRAARPGLRQQDVDEGATSLTLQGVLSLAQDICHN
jgi:hypothetical protein